MLVGRANCEINGQSDEESEETQNVSQRRQICSNRNMLAYTISKISPIGMEVLVVVEALLSADKGNVK